MFALIATNLVTQLNELVIILIDAHIVIEDISRNFHDL